MVTKTITISKSTKQEFEKHLKKYRLKKLEVIDSLLKNWIEGGKTDPKDLRKELTGYKESYPIYVDKEVWEEAWENIKGRKKSALMENLILNYLRMFK